MKMVFAIISKSDEDITVSALNEAGFFATKLSTTGGFLMAGNMTLLICTEDERVDACIGIISQFCKQRTEIVPGAASIVLWSNLLVSFCGEWIMQLLSCVLMAACAGYLMSRLKSGLGTAMLSVVFITPLSIRLATLF